MATKKTTKSKKKKNINIVVDTARAYINASFNNTLISITDDNGNILSWSSAGHLGFKGAKKATPYASQLATENALEKSKKYAIKAYKLFISGVGPGREAAIKTFQSKELLVSDIKDITPIPHNGCRPKKPRKV